MADKSDLILERLDNHIETQEKFEKRVEPALLSIAKFEGKILFIENSLTEYKDKQIPTCDKKFNLVFNRLWWIVSVFITIMFAVVGFMVKVR